MSVKAWYFNLDFSPCSTGELWEALLLEKRFNQHRGKLPFVVSVAGAGGKTSLIRRLAWEGREKGYKILVTTTTHMYRPRCFGVFDQSPDTAKDMLEQEGIAVCGVLEENGKISFPGRDFYEAVCPAADFVFAEADGSRRLPLKTPASGEPVILDHTCLILCAAGLSCAGEMGAKACFRLEEAKKLLGLHGFLAEEWKIQPEDIELLLKKGYLEPLRKQFLGAQVIPVLNQADSDKLQAMGIHMLARMGESEGILTCLLEDKAAGFLF